MSENDNTSSNEVGFIQDQMSLFGHKNVWLVRSVGKYWSRHGKVLLLIWSQKCLIGQVRGKVLTTWYVYYKSETLVTASHSLVLERQVNVMTDPSPEESPTRYMLPDQEGGEGMVDYSLNDHLPARYPTFNKKRKKLDKKKKTKKIKKEPGKSVQFKPTVTLKTIYRTLRSQIEEIGLANEDDYSSRVTAFGLKQKSQKEILKY